MVVLLVSTSVVFWLANAGQVLATWAGANRPRGDHFSRRTITGSTVAARRAGTAMAAIGVKIKAPSLTRKSVGRSPHRRESVIHSIDSRRFDRSNAQRGVAILPRWGIPPTQPRFAPADKTYSLRLTAFTADIRGGLSPASSQRCRTVGDRGDRGDREPGDGIAVKLLKFTAPKRIDVEQSREAELCQRHRNLGGGLTQRGELCTEDMAEVCDTRTRDWNAGTIH